MKPLNSKKGDVFDRLYKNLFDADDIKDKSFKELDQELNDAGIDTVSYYKKIDTLVNQYKTQNIYAKADEMRKTLLNKIAGLKGLGQNLPDTPESLMDKLRSLLGSGQAEMALRNYEFTDPEDMKNLLETLETLEELENKKDDAQNG